MVTRRVRHKNTDGTIIEADIGALAENVTEDTNHRFVTDEEKEKWNNKPDMDDIDLSGKVDEQGGDIANTVVSAFDASTAEFPVPAVGEAPKTFMGKIKKFFEDFNNIRAGLLTLGQIVNNCTSDRSDLPLAAAQGKALMEQITELNNNILGYYRATSREQSVPANTLTRLNLIGITPVWSKTIFVAEIESAEDVTAIETMFTKHFADQNSPSYSVYIKSSIAQKITINYAIFYKKP